MLQTEPEASTRRPGELVLFAARLWIPIAAAACLFHLFQETKLGLTDGAGWPFGHDFINFFAGVQMAWHGQAGEIYDRAALIAYESRVVGAPMAAFDYSYPPTMLVITAPLAVLPFVPGLFVWLATGWFCFWRALRLVLAQHALLVSLALPALFMDVFTSQNGAFSAAIIGGALALLERRPGLAGALLGLLVAKPQIGLLIPVALIAGRYWRTLGMAALVGAGLIGISVVCFGADLWITYAHHAQYMRDLVLEDRLSDGIVRWFRMISVYNTVFRLTGDPTVSYAIQGAATLLAATAVIVSWRRSSSAGPRNAVLILGNLLATPYLCDYDLVVTGFAVVWLLRDEPSPAEPDRGLLVALLMLTLLPILVAPIAKLGGVAIAPLMIVPAFALAIIRAVRPTTGRRLFPERTVRPQIDPASTM
jgi:hypothetical protein